MLYELHRAGQFPGSNQACDAGSAEEAEAAKREFLLNNVGFPDVARYTHIGPIPVTTS